MNKDILTGRRPAHVTPQKMQSLRLKNHQYNSQGFEKMTDLKFKCFVTIIVLLLFDNTIDCRHHERENKYNFDDEYYKNNSNPGAFVQIPHSNPPSVRSPPYTISDKKCPSMNVRENWLDTLCGDLNTGLVPQNPFGHKFLEGGTYPFDVIKNKTLAFFRRALPVLKKDKSLPKVARYSSNDFQPPELPSHSYRRVKRGLATRESSTSSLDAYYPDIFNIESPTVPSRRRRQHGPGHSGHGHNRFCDNAMNYYNRLCKIYNAMWGKAPHNIQRDSSIENRYYSGPPHGGKHSSPSPHHSHHYRKRQGPPPPHMRPSIDVTVIEPSKSGKHVLSASSSTQSQNQVDLPPTPCPSAAEYLTPVFARNHEGAWRYVVQIPKEGYFTQTVEVTKCLKSTCFYMDGSCKTSPRWQSLLVAELYYPDASFPTTPKPNYSSYSSESSNESFNPSEKGVSSKASGKTDPSQCDGFDKIGCYQVRLFYDWFLIPGSCKCWKRQFDFTNLRPH